MKLTRLAPAKVNLYLHVAAPDDRGYHPLQSLVAFADCGDEVRLVSRKPGEGGCLTIDGPFGQCLSTGEDNLILKAVRRFERITATRLDACDIELTKNLPIASGIGGGSADAGAVLHLLRQAYAPHMPDDVLSTIAGEIGADGVMCLWGRGALAEGYGERLTITQLPAMPAVLINPLVACSTAAVYRGFDALGRFQHIEAGKALNHIENIEALVTVLRATRNDLQLPAIKLQPVIADVIASLEAQAEVLFARMSGSGATCFALCRSDAAARDVASRLGHLWPDAWVRACRLG